MTHHGDWSSAYRPCSSADRPRKVVYRGPGAPTASSSRYSDLGNVRNPGCDGSDKEALFTIIGVYPRFKRQGLTVLRNGAMDVFGRGLPCTFRPSSFVLASLRRWATVLMIGGLLGRRLGQMPRLLRCYGLPASSDSLKHPCGRQARCAICLLPFSLGSRHRPGAEVWPARQGRRRFQCRCVPLRIASRFFLPLRQRCHTIWL